MRVRMKGVGEGERPERVIRESERERGDERMLAAIGRRQPRVGLANPATQLRCGPAKMAHNDARGGKRRCKHPSE